MSFTALAWLALCAAAPQTAVDAERAFAADAQTMGQWTAFRKWAAPDAIMFLPQPTNVHEWLKDRKDPQLSYMWWPAEAVISRDGTTAVTTGPAVRGSYRGYFTTVWRLRPEGWRWVVDHGDAVAKPRPAADDPPQSRALCVPPSHALGPVQPGEGRSPDGSLRWVWDVRDNGTRTLLVEVWECRGRWHTHLLDRVPPLP